MQFCKEKIAERLGKGLWARGNDGIFGEYISKKLQKR